MIRSYFSYKDNHETNEKVEETSFVSHISYTSKCSILYLSKILLTKLLWTSMQFGSVFVVFHKKQRVVKFLHYLFFQIVQK